MGFTATLKLVGKRYWTSGSSEGQGCLKQYGWCNTDTMFSGFAANFSRWDGGKPSNPYDERCVQLQLDTDPKNMLFEDLACTEKRYFLCEVIQFLLGFTYKVTNNMCLLKGPTPDCTPTCPASDKCQKDVSVNTNFAYNGYTFCLSDDPV